MIITILLKGVFNMRRLSAQVLIFVASFAFTLCPISNAADLTSINTKCKSTSLRKEFAPIPLANNSSRASSKIVPSHPKRSPHLSIKHTKGESRWKSIPNKANQPPSESWITYETVWIPYAWSTIEFLRSKRRGMCSLPNSMFFVMSLALFI